MYTWSYESAKAYEYEIIITAHIFVLHTYVIYVFCCILVCIIKETRLCLIINVITICEFHLDTVFHRMVVNQFYLR